MDENVKFVIDEIFEWFEERHSSANSVLTMRDFLTLINPTPQWYPEQKEAIGNAIEYLVENELILFNDKDMIKYIVLTEKGYNCMRKNY